MLLAAGGIVSCGGEGPSSTTSGSATSPKLTINASALDFGSVAVGSRKSSAIILSNSSSAGSPNVVVTQVAATGSGFTVKAPIMPFTLAAGQNSSLTITFKPLSAGMNQGQLSVSIQGGSQPALVGLSGLGLAAGQLGINPIAMNFGSVAVGASQHQTGSLSAGGADVTISTASWKGSGFALSGVGFPVIVKANASVPFTVTFTPQSSGAATGEVSFYSDASTSPIGVSLTGTGTQLVQHTVNLSWNLSTSQVAGYNVYRSTQSRGSYVRLNTSLITTSTYVDDAVQSGITYYYAATSVDSNNVESAYSNIATAVIP